MSGYTTDPNDPRLGRGVDSESVPQHSVYLVLSEEERAKGFVRPLRRSYVHLYWLDGSDAPLPAVIETMDNIGGCGALTRMGLALCETYARDPSFYGATYCVACSKHLPVSQFRWDEDGTVVGS